MANALKALSGNFGNDAVAAGGAIGAKTKMIQEYKDATTPKAAPVAKPAPPPADSGKRYGDKPGEKRIDVSSYQKPLGSYKKGGKVKKTGTYKLHAKERVLNPKQTAKFEKKGGLAALAGKK